MPEWRIVDDVFVPEYVKTIQLTVNDPAKLLKEMPDILIEVWRRTGPNVFEDSMKWDVVGDAPEFYGSWRIRDTKDARTTMWGTIMVQGKQGIIKMEPSEEDPSKFEPKIIKHGSITIWLRGTMTTKIPFTTPIDKSIAWAYMYLFYAERKREYMVKAKEHFDRFENVIREKFGITTTTHSRLTE